MYFCFEINSILFFVFLCVLIRFLFQNSNYGPRRVLREVFPFCFILCSNFFRQSENENRNKSADSAVRSLFRCLRLDDTPQCAFSNRTLLCFGASVWQATRPLFPVDIMKLLWTISTILLISSTVAGSNNGNTRLDMAAQRVRLHIDFENCIF